MLTNGMSPVEELHHHVLKHGKEYFTKKKFSQRNLPCDPILPYLSNVEHNGKMRFYRIEQRQQHLDQKAFVGYY
jgi:hypothetical protein